MKQPREELKIIEDLTTLAGSVGYAHALAHICQRDSVIGFQDSLKPSDLDRLFDKDRLIRTELMTLIGLMAKTPLDLTQQPINVIEEYVQRTEVLMCELYNSISHPIRTSILKAAQSSTPLPDLLDGAGMREPIFYGPESAYSFQYRDFSSEKYEADNEWMRKYKGFTSDEARTIAKTMCSLIDEKLSRLDRDHRENKTPPPTWLPAFEFSLDEVASHSGAEKVIVEAFFNAFLFAGNNSGFKDVGDFNEVAAKPLLPTNRGTVLLFSHYAIYEALYESPFFWMLEDNAYRARASQHRGAFTEQFAAQRLSKVFGCKHVHTNVNLHCGKDIVGEVDVLVIYGDRLIILQAKAKKLTIAARKGNDSKLKKDFVAAIQDSYDQGLRCAVAIVAGQCLLADENKNEIKLPAEIKEVFLFTLVSEHYPALAFQARQWLKFQTTGAIRPPFVMDIFLLDVLTEVLSTPLQLLSYVKLRVADSEKLVSGHELTVLGYYLKTNLWLNEEDDLVMLDDSIAQDLNTSMLVRREKFPGEETPAGILTKMRGTLYESLIKELEARADSAAIELGLYLLSLGEDSRWDIHRALLAITRKTKFDGMLHNATLASNKNPSGITFHCNPIPSTDAIITLHNYCTKRKYQRHAAHWFGVSVNPEGQFQFGFALDYPWELSEEMEQLTVDMKLLPKTCDVLPQYLRGTITQKLGRNDPCHCGSGLKYKKCCLT